MFGALLCLESVDSLHLTRWNPTFLPPLANLESREQARPRISHVRRHSTGECLLTQLVGIQQQTRPDWERGRMKGHAVARLDALNLTLLAPPQLPL